MILPASRLTSVARSALCAAKSLADPAHEFAAHAARARSATRRSASAAASTAASTCADVAIGNSASVAPSIGERASASAPAPVEPCARRSRYGAQSAGDRSAGVTALVNVGRFMASDPRSTPLLLNRVAICDS